VARHKIFAPWSSLHYAVVRFTRLNANIAAAAGFSRNEHAAASILPSECPLAALSESALAEAAGNARPYSVCRRLAAGNGCAGGVE